MPRLTDLAKTMTEEKDKANAMVLVVTNNNDVSHFPSTQPGQ